MLSPFHIHMHTIQVVFRDIVFFNLRDFEDFPEMNRLLEFPFPFFFPPFFSTLRLRVPPSGLCLI